MCLFSMAILVLVQYCGFVCFVVLVVIALLFVLVLVACFMMVHYVLYLVVGLLFGCLVVVNSIARLFCYCVLFVLVLFRLDGC